jgi:nucleoside-diphosphate-sugar epimerase
VPAVILRATQTFGPGVKYEDGRVFAEFMRCAVEKRNIVLKSDGSTERCYLYTADAVSAILVALLKGEPGQAYTVANKDT